VSLPLLFLLLFLFLFLFYLPRKDPKVTVPVSSISGSETMMIFGGSPIAVAVPPKFVNMISVSRMG
jgi:hypothetical protein